MRSIKQGVQPGQEIKIGWPVTGIRVDWSGPGIETYVLRVDGGLGQRRELVTGIAYPISDCRRYVSIEMDPRSSVQGVVIVVAETPAEAVALK